MKLTLNGRNLVIKNKKAITFQEIEMTETMFLTMDEQGIALETGKVMIEEVHVCMYCELLQNITWILVGDEIDKITMVFGRKETFRIVMEEIRRRYRNLELSEQNKKINGYATAFVEKMRAGIELHVVESSDEVEVPICPVCGMQCDPDIPYCMECGANVE